MWSRSAQSNFSIHSDPLTWSASEGSQSAYWSLPSLAPDVVTARALAPVSKLMKLIENQISPNTVCLFLKGASVEDELTDLQSYSTMVPVSHPASPAQMVWS